MPRLPDWTLCPRPWPGRAGRLAAPVQQPVAAFAKGRVRWPCYVADARISFASFTNESAVPDQFAARFQLDRCAGRPPASQPSRSSACAPAAGRCPLRRALASDLADCAAGHARSMRRRRPMPRRQCFGRLRPSTSRLPSTRVNAANRWQIRQSSKVNLQRELHYSIGQRTGIAARNTLEASTSTVKN